ncbi:MAG: hypothetical protein ACM3ZO_00350 [Clostridia bacterium]
MGPLLGANTGTTPGPGVRKPARKLVVRLAAGLALAVVAAAVLAGMRIGRQALDESMAKAPSTEAGRHVMPEKWHELQKPLPSVVQTGKDEEAIPFRARASADPFAPDSLIAQYYRKQEQKPDTAAGQVMDATTRVTAGVPAAGVPNARTEPAVPSGERPPDRGGEAESSLSSSTAPGSPEPVTVAQLPAVPPAAPQPEGTQPANEAAPRAASPAASPAGSPITAGWDDKKSGSAGAKAQDVADVPPTSKDGGRKAAETAAPERMAPPAPPVEPPAMLVTGIISAGDSVAYAIVRTPRGSIIVRPGDEAEGVTVKSVGDKCITVVKEGEEFVLELGGGSER